MGMVLWIYCGMRLAILIIFMNILCPSGCPGQSGWKLQRDKEGITIYVRELADNPLKEYKARAIIAQPMEELFGFLSDLGRRPEWVFRCTGLTIIEKDDRGRTRYHTSYDIPWPMKDRDLTAETVVIHHAGGSRIECLTQSSPLDFPLEEGVIRMPSYREWVMLEKMDSQNTLFITEGHADPGGKVPPWLVNMFLVDGIYDSVIRAREILLDQER